jgi:hypothetical protein
VQLYAAFTFKDHCSVGARFCALKVGIEMTLPASFARRIARLFEWRN